MVVDNQVNDSAHRVVREVLHLNAFVHNTLTSERRITVNNDRNDRIAFVVRHEVLLSASATHGDGVDRLQVRGVCEQCDLNRDFIWAVLAVERGAQVVFDIT